MIKFRSIFSIFTGLRRKHVEKEADRKQAKKKEAHRRKHVEKEADRKQAKRKEAHRRLRVEKEADKVHICTICTRDRKDICCEWNNGFCYGLIQY